MSHLSGQLNLQARSRRNALHATRVLRMRRAEQRELTRALEQSRAGPCGVPAPSTSPEDPRASRRGATGQAASHRIGVQPLKSGWWTASCACGGHPEPFDQERAAWRWVTEHACRARDGAARTD